MFGPYSGNPWIICAPETESYWESQSLQADTSVTVDALDTFGFSRCQLVWTRTTPTGTREDVVVVSRDWVHAVGGAAVPLATGEKTEIETALNAWFTSAASLFPTTHTLTQYRWYDYQPITTRPGPAAKLTAKSSGIGTTAGGRLADQLAVTQTFQTASRAHWGRWYLPMASSSHNDSVYGRVTNTAVDSINAATTTLLGVAGSGGGINPCVASIRYKGVLGIRQLQTDNIWDVIRSRRAKTASYYKRTTS